MKLTRRTAALGGLNLLSGAAMCTSLRADWDSPLISFIEGGEEFWLATDAYIYGYPLVTMEMTRRIMTNVAAPEGNRAPMGQFAKAREYPNASFRDVTAPNADTLYTLAWIDVGTEPWVLSIPDMKDRYYLVPLLDAWTNVFQVPGKRTTGTGAQTYAITGPGWKGTLPAGVKEYKSPTNLVWILGRIYCTGTPEDYAAVHAAQDQFKLAPLSAYGKAYAPPEATVNPSIDMKTAVRDQVNRMDPTAYFTLLAQLIKTNPPAAADAPELAKLAKQGKIAPESRLVLARSRMGVMVRSGAPKPDVSTVDAFKRTLLGAKSIAFPPEGQSGIYLIGLIERLGLTEALKDKLKRIASGPLTGETVAKGEAEIGITPIGELLAVKGVSLAGPLPAAVQNYIVQTAGISPGAAQGAAARDFLKFLAAPQNAPVILEKGMELG